MPEVFDAVSSILGFTSEFFTMDFKFAEAKWFGFFSKLFAKLAETLFTA